MYFPVILILFSSRQVFKFCSEKCLLCDSTTVDKNTEFIGISAHVPLNLKAIFLIKSVHGNLLGWELNWVILEKCQAGL